MAEWTKTVRHFARLFRRGWKKKVYRAVCKADGFKSCPEIIGPLKVRMAVHCGKFLKQSCQHHSMRCAAVAAALQRLHGNTRKSDVARMHKQLSALDHRLRSLHVFVAMLVEECLHMPGGVMSGCLVVQASERTFFPTHMARAIMFFNTLHLGFPQVELHRSLATIVGQGNVGSSSKVVPGFRCQCCGLLVREAASMMKHLKAAHRHSCSPHPDLYEPQQVWRLAHCFGGAAAPSNAHASCPRQCAFASLVYSQPGAKPVSLEVVAAYGAFFLGLLSYVHFSDTRVREKHDSRIRGFTNLGHHDWCACVLALLPRVVRRQSPRWWSAYPVAVLTGTFQGQQLWGLPGSSAGAPQSGGPGSSAGTSHSPDSRGSLAELARGRARLDALNVARCLLYAINASQHFFFVATQQYDEHVLQSHGDHVPALVRDSATFAFWLPELFRPDMSHAGTGAGDAGDEFPGPLRTACFEDVWIHVSARLGAFAWPTKKVGLQQYAVLMRHWVGLVRSNEGVRAAAYNDRGDFQWESWWAMSHTGTVPAHQDQGQSWADFVPSGTEAAFTVFHFSGSWGASEAHCESIAGTLKRFRKGLATSSVVEAAILRSNGLTGYGGEDDFVQVCWARFFGTADFDRKGFTINQRLQRSTLRHFPLGRGSRTVQRTICKVRKPTWTRQHLRQAVEEHESRQCPRRFRQWQEELRKVRGLRQGDVC